MNEETREYIKLGLLGLISLLLIMQTAMLSKNIEDEAVIASGSNFSTPAPSPSASKNLLTPQQSSTIAQPALPDNTPKTSIKFEKEIHDFGTLKQNTTDNQYIFTFTNTGDEPLIITNAKGSCGCTVPKYPTEPIAPGETGEIEVNYSPGTQKGNQTKTVTVTANTEPAQTRLSITAVVEVVE